MTEARLKDDGGEAQGMTATRIDVNPSSPSEGGSPYQVVVGVGVLGELPGLVPEGARTVVVIHAEGLGEIARPACGALRAAGLTVHAEPVPDGEAAKTAEVAAGLWSRLARHGVTRSDCVVGIGGGGTTHPARVVAPPRLPRRPGVPGPAPPLSLGPPA